MKSLAARLVFVAAIFMTTAAGSPSIVQVTGGKIAGEASEDGQALVFRAIPFAAPPLGIRRWTAPDPVPAWLGVRDATQRGAACLQNDYGWNTYDDSHDSEDCLTLDIRTPGLTGKRPVMVWIHGGSNRAGSSGDTVLSTITRHDIVVVAVQYRLGIFGFLAPRSAAASESGAAGNYGLMDQIAALKWVQQNIARFGGDPTKVTIAGESAGAQDVGLLLSAPAARPLFARAIMESGTPGFGMAFRTLAQAKKLADQVDAMLDTGGDVGKLKAASGAALLAADKKLHDRSISTDEFMWLKTTIDGAVLPSLPQDGGGKPVLIGSNRAEFGPTAGSATFPAAFALIFGLNAERAARLYRFDDPSRLHDPRLGHSELEVATDWIFRCPAGRMADLLSHTGSPVWRYEFDLPGDTLSAHAGELRYIFDDVEFAPSVSMQRYWVNFVKTGTPNERALPTWPQYDATRRQHIIFDKRGVTADANLRGDICALLDKI